jgi:predicted dehydrogenase
MNPKNHSSSPSCRWGILGAAFIARKNWQSIRDAGNATLVALASRDIAKAQAFIDECQAQVPHAVKPEALGSYEALLARPDINAVYIPLPTGLRKEWVIRAARAGKHVLVEKPVGCIAADVAEMLDACEQHHVQFMDGVMFMHGRRLQQLRGVLDTEVGLIQHIATQFSFLAADDFAHTNIRAHGALEPLGCLGDLGWYCLRFTLWAMGENAPLSVTGRIHAETQQSADAPPVPLAFSGTLNFAGGVSASYYCSFIAQHAQWAIVSGTKGLLQVSDFVLPFFGVRRERLSGRFPRRSSHRANRGTQQQRPRFAGVRLVRGVLQARSHRPTRSALAARQPAHPASPRRLLALRPLRQRACGSWVLKSHHENADHYPPHSPAARVSFPRLRRKM